MNKNNIMKNYYDSSEIIQPKEGDFFGMIFEDPHGILIIEPNIDINRESKVNSLNYYYSINQELTKKFFKETDFPIPFILKKLKGNLAQDILTGIVFHIQDKQDFYCENKMLDKNEQFQDKQNLFRENPIVLSPEYVKLSLIDDNFKFVYYNLISDKKNEVIEKLNSLKLSAQQNFDKKITEGVDIAQAVAETDNLIYVYKHKN